MRERVGGSEGCKAREGRGVRGAIAAGEIYRECQGEPRAARITERGLWRERPMMSHR